MAKGFKDPYPTPHLISRMKDREVTWGEIVDIVEKPEVIYGPDHKGRQIMQRGDLSVVVAKDGAVVTVLLRAVYDWEDDQAKNRK